jgi:hypothetical protein
VKKAAKEWNQSEVVKSERCHGTTPFFFQQKYGFFAFYMAKETEFIPTS